MRCDDVIVRAAIEAHIENFYTMALSLVWNESRSVDTTR